MAAQRNHYPNETLEQRKKRLAEKQRLKRANQTGEQRSKRLIGEAIRQRNRRAKETEKEHLQRIAVNLARHKNHIANETEVNRAQRLQNDAARKRNIRSQVRSHHNLAMRPDFNNIVHYSVGKDNLTRQINCIVKETEENPVQPLQNDAARKQNHHTQEEPLKGDVELLEASVDPFNIKTEPNCKDEDGSSTVEEEPQLAGARNRVKTEPLDVLQDAAWQHQDLHWTSPGSVGAEDRKPLREHSEIAHIGEHSSTQPPHGRWTLWMERGLPSLVKVDPLDPDSEGTDPGITPSEGTPVKVENARMDEFYSAEDGCSEESEILGLPHDEEEVFGCSSCEIKPELHLEKHLSAHINEEKYRCMECDKHFCNLSNLSRHTRMHTGEKPYECAVCKRLFTTSYNLSRHRVTHTGEKHFHCKVCNRYFSSSSNLIRHGKKHGRKPVQVSWDSTGCPNNAVPQTVQLGS